MGDAGFESLGGLGGGFDSLRSIEDGLSEDMEMVGDVTGDGLR